MVLVNIFFNLAVICFGTGAIAMFAGCLGWNFSKCFDFMVDAFQTGSIFGVLAFVGLLFV